jgi:predicted O-methyltransferase YrrM
MTLEVIRLEQFLKRHLNGGGPVDIIKKDAVQAINQRRDREMILRRYLPPQLVRRLDVGFARSNTIHPDTAQALYNICYTSQIQNVFETGTYWGFSTTYLAAALQDKGAGKVYTFDIYGKAGKHIPKSLMSRIEMFRGRRSTEAMQEVLARVTPDLFFQDSVHDYEGVVEELELVAHYLKPGAVVLFHDFVEPQVRQAARDVLAGYEMYVLDTSDPQQLGVAFKV